jgi:hypothetical protein
MLLEAVGCDFGNVGSLTHDQLDAALCAALGWRLFYPDDRWAVELAPTAMPEIAQNCAVFRDANGILREGRMLMPKVAFTPMRPRSGPNTMLRPARELRRDLTGQHVAGEMQLPQCDWVYFAGTARANRTETYAIAVQEEIIVRTLYNTAGLCIPNVKQLEPGHKLLLAYGGQGMPYRALCWCRIASPDQPVQRDGHLFPACGLADPTLHQLLLNARYAPDPVLKQFTVIPITEINDVHEFALTAPHPRGNNAIRRWHEVFPI